MKFGRLKRSQRNWKGQSHSRKGIASHQRTEDLDLRARQFSGLGLNIDGVGWYRLMYIHRYLDLLNLTDASVICLSSLVLRHEERVGPFLPRRFRRRLLPWRGTRRGISWLPPRTQHGLSSPLICSVSLFIASSPRPYLVPPTFACSTSVMMNGVAGGGIYPEIQRPGGIY